MKKRTARRTRPADLSVRGIGALPWSYFVLIAICGCIIAAGFLLAARQHFVSMDLGMKNSKLRKQLEDLEAENRRLMLAREIALSPMEITRAAKRLGFAEYAANVQPTELNQPSPAKPKQTIAAEPASIVRRGSANEPSVTKTSLHRPSVSAYPQPASLIVRERIIKTPDDNGKKRDKQGAAKDAKLR